MIDSVLNFLFGVSKYKHASGIEYDAYSTREKMRYHRHHKQDVEILPYDTPISLAVERVYNRILRSQRERNDSNFTIVWGTHKKSALESAEIYRKTPKGRRVILTVESCFLKIISITIKIEGLGIVAFMDGRDNVINWKSKEHRESVREALDALYHEDKTQKWNASF